MVVRLFDAPAPPAGSAVPEIPLHDPASMPALRCAGCGGDDGIRSYSVPRSTEREARPEPAGDYRLLGAMFPAADPVWFFKFNGPAEQVTEFEADFDKIMASVKLSG